MTTAKQSAQADKKLAAKPAKKSSAAAGETKPPSRRSVSLPKSGKDPKGGLTAEGRRVFNEATGGHLKPGVKGEADTPEKMVRKGSFLRRHFAHPQGPVVDDAGQPTRQALEAAAWGEPVPKSEADEQKLADKGTELLEQYHAAKGEVKSASGRWKAAPKADMKTETSSKPAAKKPAAKKLAAKKPIKKSTAKKAAVKAKS